ncbi:signal recognition particle-docking protein FtsY [candidate division KSB1 bacterium]|nr:signal recognition particle-docking protein FtsY [candidate division KSB1 bacterium]
MALFNKLRSKLSKTRTGLFNKLQSTISLKPKIDEELFEEIEEILITSDVGIDTTLSIIDGVRSRVKQGRITESQEVHGILREEIKGLLNSNNHETSPDFFMVNAKPYVIMVVGVNGTGKTTTIGKLALNFKKKDKRVLVAAADTFRAAASDQLEIWAKRSGSQIVRQDEGADAASVAYDAISASLARDIDVVIVDTAGRLHTKTNLMEELKKVDRVIAKQIPNAPHERLLVLDGTTGQNARRQVEEFGNAINLTGLVLTKLDGTAKGGVVIGIANDFKIPIKFIGLGEQIDDLEPFDSNSFVDAIFDPAFK